MDDPPPLVCVFFQLPPSDQLFMRIHDIPWQILLPQLENLTSSLATLLRTNPSPMAMETLLEARKVMGGKMIPFRDFMLSGRDLSRHYVKFVDGVSNDKMLNASVKAAYSVISQEAAKKSQDAGLALSEFREELESVVGRIIALVSEGNNDVSLFINESSQVVSVMITAIEECSALLQECRDGFLNIKKQAFDRESFERNPPTDDEFQLVREKWEMLQNFLHEISVDWNLLESHIEDPFMNASNVDVTPSDVPGALALTGASENTADPENPPDVPVPTNPTNPEAPNPPPEKVKISFWRKFFRRVSTCFSSRPFC